MVTPFTSIELRIKIISLADEARTIRRWEGRMKRAARGRGTGEQPERPDLKATFWSLREHRQSVVSNEARHSLLAFGFLRGKPYKRLEQRRYCDPSWVAVQDIAKRFGKGAYDEKAFQTWREAAGECDVRYPRNKKPDLNELLKDSAVREPFKPSAGSLARDDTPPNPKRKKFLGII